MKEITKILDHLYKDRKKICGVKEGNKVVRWKPSFFQIGQMLCVLNEEGWKFYPNKNKADYFAEQLDIK